MKLSRLKLPRPRTVIALAASVLAAAAGAAGLTLEHVAQDRIAHSFDCRLHPRGATSVALTDTLAGLDLLTGEVGTVRIDAQDVTRQGMRMNLAVQLAGVTTHGTSHGGTVTATLPLSELQQRLPGASGSATLGAQDGDLTFTTTAGPLGIPVTVLAAVTTTAHSLTITPRALDLMGRQIPVAALEQSGAPASMTARLKPHTMPLSGLSAGTTLKSADVGPDGLALHLALSRNAAGSAGPRTVGPPSSAACGSARSA